MQEHVDHSAGVPGMELRDYLAIVWRGKWVVIVLTIVAAASAYMASRLSTPVFEASTTLLVSQARNARAADYSDILASELLASTYAQMIAKRPVLQGAVTRLELDSDLENLKKAIDVQIIPDTQLIEVRLEDPDPVSASVLANTIVEVFIEQNNALQAERFALSKVSLSGQLDKLNEQITLNESAIEQLGDPQAESEKADLDRLQTKLAQYQASYTSLLQSYEDLRIAEAALASSVVQIDPAVPPEKHIRPRTTLNTLIAGAVGAFLAICAVFLIEHLDDAIRTQTDAERVFHAPVIASIPESTKLGVRDSAWGAFPADPSPAMAEAFRSLRTALEFADGPIGPRTILISSLDAGEGKTTVAMGLAASISKTQKRIALVDVNTWNPSIHKFLGIQNKLGFSDMLVDDLVPQVVAQSTGSTRLKVITNGQPVDSALELLESVWFLKALTRLKEQADVIIFDGPPLLTAEALLIASKIQSLLVVVQPGKSSEAAAREAVQHIDRAKANVVGVVLNRVSKKQMYGLQTQFYNGRSPALSKRALSDPTSAAQSKNLGQVVLRKERTSNN